MSICLVMGIAIRAARTMEKNTKIIERRQSPFASFLLSFVIGVRVEAFVSLAFCRIVFYCQYRSNDNEQVDFPNVYCTRHSRSQTFLHDRVAQVI